MLKLLGLSPLLLVLFSSLVNAQLKSTTCYAPNGVDTAQPDFEPCIMVAGVDSMCCAWNRTSNADTCQSNGLCRNTLSNELFGDFCTDPTWKSPNCLSLTTYSAKNGCSQTGFQEMTECTDGTFCCGANNFTACCDKNLGFKLAASIGIFSTQSATATGTATSSSAKVTVTVTSSITSSATAASLDSSQKSATNSSNMHTTIGLGVGLALLAFVGTAGGFWAGLRRGQGKSIGIGQHGNEGSHWAPMPSPLPPKYGGNTQVHRVTAYEMEGFPAVELESRGK